MPSSPARTSRPSSRRREFPSSGARRRRTSRPEVLPRPHVRAGARIERQADDRPASVDTIAGWGREAATSHPRRGETSSRAQFILVNQLAAFNSPVWFNVGFERSRSARRASSSRSTDSLSRSSTGSAARRYLPRRLGLRRQPLAPRLVEGAASPKAATRPGLSPSCAEPTPPPNDQVRRKTRRARRWSSSTSIHPDIEEFVWCKAREEQKARVLSRLLRYVAPTRPTGPRSSTRTRTLRPHHRRVIEAVEAGGEWNLTAPTTAASSRRSTRRS